MAGVVLAFKDYKVSQGIFGSRWVGLENFKNFFGSYYAFRVIRNAVVLNILGLVFSFPLPIILALLLNEVRREWFKRIIQTITYFPHFISTVIIVGIVFAILSPDLSIGVLNQFLMKIFGLKSPINFLAESRYFRTIYITIGIWQGTGFGAIIYLAALSSVDPQLYEAAIIDGANRLQLIRYISIPSILPTIVILLILNISGLLRSGMETILLLYNPSTYEVADVIETFVFRRGILGEGGLPDYSFATAVGFFQSLVGLLLIIIANKMAKKLTDSSLW